MNTQELNKLAKRVHALNKSWWIDIETGKPIKRNNRELLMLVITELSEAVEGIRKNLMDDKLPHRKMEEVEMADAAIRLLDFSGGFKIELSSVEGKRAILSEALKELGENKAEQILSIVASVIAFSPSIALAEIEEYCKMHGLDLWGAVEEKLAYNAKRADHKHENRRKAGGKKF